MFIHYSHYVVIIFENMWLTYSLLGLLFLWMTDFIKKAMLKKWWDKEVFILLSGVFYMIIFWINYYFASDFIINDTLIQSVFIIGFFDFLTPVWLLTALKYIDTSLTFISIRITASFLVLYIGTQILWDNLSLYNIIWFLIWVIAIFFLSWFNFHDKHKINKKWLWAIVIAIIWITWAHSYFKYVVNDINIASYMFFKMIISCLFIILYMTLRKKFYNFNKKEIKKIMVYTILSCSIFTIYYLYLLPNIYILWPLSLWYKFLSYSIIVPIILSMILYKEKTTKIKIFAFILTIISIGLFLV
jgi:hypothetical protein